MLFQTSERIQSCRRPSPWVLGLVTTLSLVPAACGNGDVTEADETTGTSSATTTSTTTMTSSGEETTTSTQANGVVLSQSCTNPEDGYSIQFPDGWFANEGDVVPTCRFFHPQPFKVPEATEVFGLAVAVKVDDVPFSRVASEVASEEDSLGERVLSREETTLAGQQAVRVEAQSTGDVLLPEGVHTYRYHVEVGNGTLTATTHDVGELDYEGNKEVLDEMMETLELDAA